MCSSQEAFDWQSSSSCSLRLTAGLEGQRSEVPVRTNPGPQSQDAEWLVSTLRAVASASANPFLAALLRLWSVEAGAELYMVIRSRRRAPAAPASCMFRFSPTPKIVAKIVAGKKEKTKQRTQLCGTISVFFRRKGSEYELQPGERRKALCKAVSHELLSFWSSSTWIIQIF